MLDLYIGKQLKYYFPNITSLYPSRLLLCTILQVLDQVIRSHLNKLIDLYKYETSKDTCAITTLMKLPVNDNSIPNLIIIKLRDFKTFKVGLIDKHSTSKYFVN